MILTLSWNLSNFNWVSSTLSWRMVIPWLLLWKLKILSMILMLHMLNLILLSRPTSKLSILPIVTILNNFKQVVTWRLSHLIFWLKILWNVRRNLERRCLILLVKLFVLLKNVRIILEKKVSQREKQNTHWRWEKYFLCSLWAKRI